MNTDGPFDIPTQSSTSRGWVALAFAAYLCGLFSGLVAALFRLALGRVDTLRGALVTWAQAFGLPGCLLMMALVAVMAAMAAWLVQRFAPSASGSGIPHVEAVVCGELPPAPFRLLPVKFLGGLLAIGSGLALGREGPSVQMGASVGGLLSRRFRFSDEQTRALLAAGAGAGLATAFNAPLAGAVFVLEELVRRFDVRIAVAALSASAGAIFVARVFYGSAPDFAVPAIAFLPLGVGWIFFGLGLLAGVAGAAYTRAILMALRFADRLRARTPLVPAAIVGAAVGALAWWSPSWVGGGDPLTQAALSGEVVLALLPWLFFLRFFLGAACYAAGTPGGIFAPMLVLGAQLGLLFSMLLPGTILSDSPPQAFAVVGMAAFFIAVVRSPLTGIVLVTELTGSFPLLLPMLAAGTAAMIVAPMLGAAPIYDALKERTLASARRSDSSKPIVVGDIAQRK